MTGCEVGLYESFGSDMGILIRNCGRPAVAQVLQGCVHEHIEEAWVCRAHLEDDDREQFCTFCGEAGCYPCGMHQIKVIRECAGSAASG